MTTMVGLVIEQVQQNVRDPLFLRLPAQGPVDMQTIKIRVSVTGDARFETVILMDPGTRKIDQIFVDDGVQPIRVIPLAGQASQP